MVRSVERDNPAATNAGYGFVSHGKLPLNCWERLAAVLTGSSERRVLAAKIVPGQGMRSNGLINGSLMLVPSEKVWP